MPHDFGFQADAYRQDGGLPGAPYDFYDHPEWRQKPLTPAQLLVHDVRLESWRADRGPMLEINERSTPALVPHSAAITTDAQRRAAASVTHVPIEKQRMVTLEAEFGWIRHLRLSQIQRTVSDSEQSAKCRWTHCSSKFPDYLRGFLWALRSHDESIAETMRLLDHAIQHHTRFSKHGKYFSPFFQHLNPKFQNDNSQMYPMLVSVPFLDWTVLGETPPLRFQVDKREAYSSSRSSAHPLRSVLQHYYRLEDTTDRESSQVFAKHKPWTTNRELDLKVRQWYGHYPSGLNVDELWILAIDAENIVTLSSNQTWKARWPALQLTSRIADVSFRGLRNNFFTSRDEQEYSTALHTIVCLSGAVGLMHRNFWSDMILPLTDRYAGYLSHLQYRLHRAPSTKLVMDLMACQEEINIVIQVTQQQLDMISDLQNTLTAKLLPVGTTEPPNLSAPRSRAHSRVHNNDFPVDFDGLQRATYRALSTSTLADPVSQLLDNLQRELIDLQDLRDNTDRLVTRTIQLVNIRLEDHGKAILVFTVVTIIFLPLNFVSSFFGMNVSDIRNMNQTQSLFWLVSLCVTAAVVAIALFLAFAGGNIFDKMVIWRDTRQEDMNIRRSANRTDSFQSIRSRHQSFQVYGVDRDERYKALF